MGDGLRKSSFLFLYPHSLSLPHTTYLSMCNSVYDMHYFLSNTLRRNIFYRLTISKPYISIKKTKILTGWFTWIYTPHGREQYIQKAKEFNFYNSYKHDNLSYSIQKERWSLSSNRLMTLNVAYYSTEGSVVDQSTYKNPEWFEMTPILWAKRYLRISKKDTDDL